ncbi:MAG: methyltransferase domain-containing protein [Sandaracinaceae bacterium]|nr:methyltransferase domain-containing protein [Sandaracinaceae bacterium]
MTDRIEGARTQSRLERAFQKHVLSHLLDDGMRGVEPLRGELLAGVGGRVLELGFGTGSNLPYYRGRTAGMSELVAIEPAEGLAELAKERLDRWTDRTGVPSRLEVLSGSRPLPFDDASFDRVVITFVLCSVRRADVMLAEARRVLAPGGRLVIAEHVGARPGAMRTAQRVVRPAWKALLGGCDPLTDARGAIAAAGFDTGALGDRRLELPWIVSSGLVGEATVASDAATDRAR